MLQKFMVKTVAITALSIAAFTVSSGTLSAQTGSRINFTGSAIVGNQPGSGGANLLIDFLTGSPEPITPGAPSGNVTATQIINGVFAIPGGITSGTQGVIQDLVTSNASFLALPIANFVTIGGFTFSLLSAPAGNSFGPISLFDIGTGTTATFGTSGLVTGPGIGVTPFNFDGVFTAQFSGQTPAQVFADINSGNNRAVAFSAEFVVGTVVPEPSTYMLMAAGLAGLGMVARRRRSAV